MTYVPDVTDCIGGVGRLSNYIRNKMKANPHSLWVNAGNTLGGEFFKFLKYKTAIEAIKFLNFTSVVIINIKAKPGKLK